MRSAEEDFLAMLEILRALAYPFVANLEPHEKKNYCIALTIVVSLLVALLGGAAFLIYLVGLIVRPGNQVATLATFCLLFLNVG